MKTEKTSVLVTGVGAGGVGEGIVKALQMDSKKYKIFATDMNPLSAALFRVDRGYLVPEASDAQYVDKLISICKSEKIVAIIPGSVPELKRISDDRAEFEREKITPIVGSKSYIDLGLDKWKSYEFLQRNNFQYPRTFLAKESDNNVNELRFPVQIKPREGYGSKYNYVACDKDELELIVRYLKKMEVEPLIQEYVVAKECTVGVVASKSGKILGSISIMRELKSGCSYRMIVIDVAEARKIAEDIALGLHVSGPMNVQFFIKDGKPVVCEINPRFSGTTPVRSAVGFREVDAVLRNFLYGEEIQLKFRSNLIALRYLDEIYADLSSLDELRQKGNTSARGWRKRYF